MQTSAHQQQKADKLSSQQYPYGKVFEISLKKSKKTNRKLEI